MVLQETPFKEKTWRKETFNQIKKSTKSDYIKHLGN